MRGERVASVKIKTNTPSFGDMFPTSPFLKCRPTTTHRNCGGRADAGKHNHNLHLIPHTPSPRFFFHDQQTLPPLFLFRARFRGTAMDSPASRSTLLGGASPGNGGEGGGEVEWAGVLPPADPFPFLTHVARPGDLRCYQGTI